MHAIAHSSFAVRLLSLILLCLFTQGLQAQTRVGSLAGAANLLNGIWYQNDTRPGGTATIVDLSGEGGNLELAQPLPPRAALLTTDFSNAAKAEIGVLDDYGSPAAIFPSLELSYAYLKASNPGQNLSAAPSLKLAVTNPSCTDPASAGDCYVELVYEPVWNGGMPVLDQWTNVNIDGSTGLFWSTGGFGSSNSFGGPPLRTLADWLGVLSSDFASANVARVSIGVGSFNQGQIGYFDAVSIRHGAGAGFQASFDFDTNIVSTSPPARPVPLPPVSWLLLALFCAWLGVSSASRLADV